MTTEARQSLAAAIESVRLYVGDDRILGVDFLKPPDLYYIVPDRQADVIDWQCHYCGGVVKHEFYKCPSCGGEKR